MASTGRAAYALALIMVCGLGSGILAAAGEGHFAVQESFDTLQNWKPLTFPKIEQHTRYTLETDGHNSMLRADADKSASAIIHAARFSVAEFPKIRWRWKVDRVLSTGDAGTKAGDDYPIRVYVIFQYDPGQASLGERIKYGAAKAIYGEYPPHSSVNYIWANRPHPRTVIPNAYSDKARMVLLETGRANVGRWVSEERNILEDYRRAFGTDPPKRATVAIMADTDNTGERATAWLDDLAVFR